MKRIDIEEEARKHCIAGFATSDATVNQLVMKEKFDSYILGVIRGIEIGFEAARRQEVLRDLAGYGINFDVPEYKYKTAEHFIASLDEDENK